MSAFRSLAGLSLLALALHGCSPGPDVADGPGLVRAMHERYADVRPSSIVFSQQTVLHRKPDVPADTVTWYEAALPGLLRVDFAPIEEGNGALFRDGMLYSIQGGRVIKSRSEVNPLQLLLMDVFQYPPEKTVHMLDTLGFNLTLFREAEWEGRPVWIVGADEGDETSSQFWVEQERMVAVRVIQPVGGGTLTWDTRVTGFRDMGAYPQEESFVMYLDGRLIQEETYLDIRAGEEVDPALFDTTDWIVTEPYWP